MTHKERILAACRGEVPDCIPWIPRLDLWYNAYTFTRPTIQSDRVFYVALK